MVSGGRQKNIHTDYTDYMVGGGASKYIHTDYTDYIVVVYHPDGL